MNIMKKFVSFSLCVLLIFGLFNSIKSFASLKDLPIQGGSYGELCEIIKNYKGNHPEDQTEYECHYLIAKEALNRWGKRIKHKGLVNSYNEFLVNDVNQNWAPAIVMEKADYEKTLSYFNLETRSDKENQQAFDYIKWQANRIICYGDIWGVLKDESKYIRKEFRKKYDKALKQAFIYLLFYLPVCINNYMYLE